MATRRAVAGHQLLGALLVTLCYHVSSISVSSRAGRICVSSDVDCSQLRQMTRGVLDCVITRDRVDCLKKLRNGDVDFGYFEAEDQKMAAPKYGRKQTVTYEAALEFSTGKETGAVYLLVNNGSNTRPSTMCHPGFNRERLYPRALHTPTTLDTMDPTGDIQSLILSLSEAWKSACIPGAWSPDPITDRQLKRDHPHLCNSCLRKSCDTEDPYAGAGALQCLLDRAAEAAFVSDVDLKIARTKNLDVENLYHFCRDTDDPIHPLGSKTKGAVEPCDWGQRPLPVLLSRTCANDDCKSRQKIWVKALTSHASLLKGVLDLPRITQVMVKGSVMSPLEIIKTAGYKLDQSAKPKDAVTICVQTKAGLEKCLDLANAWAAYSGDGGIGIKCLNGETDSNCYPNVYFGIADVITLDGGDVYQVTQDYGFERILSEVYDEAASAPTSSYYAVAVIRAESNVTSFEHLQGKKSCHTGIDKTAGWKIPVATLLEQNLIDPIHCNYVSAMAEFFSGGSCAPGGKSSKYNKQQSYMERLCTLCRGEGADKCARSNAEPFYSYSGAFRCLVHGGGDVAFVKHTTVPSLTGGSTSGSWAIGLHADQFKLLCPSGGTAAVNEYATCNLALVPAHESVVSGVMSSERKKLVRETLLGISRVFNADAPGSKTFKLFGSYHGQSDLLFKDSAVSLRALSEDTQIERDRKKNYFKKLEELHSCEVRVCALEEKMDDCKAMAQMMLAEGHKFVCVSARDRMDCMLRVIRGQVDMSPLPGGFLGMNPDLRVFAVMRDPVYSQQEFRYKAVMVVRRSTIKSLSDLRGKKSCHTGYGKTAGWRVPLALLKREGVIQPPCNEHQSGVEREIASLAVTFNRACVPGQWAVSSSTDAALKKRYQAMCSMCRSRTCDGKDDYAGYDGALRCLTQNGGDIAFSKLSVVQDFFSNTRSLNSSDYALLCPDKKLVDFDSIEAEKCQWASRPWDAYVTHSGASDAKVTKCFWALTQAKRKAEEDLEARSWYFTTLGIGDFTDILPVMENINTRQYYSKTRMDVVAAEKTCAETAVRFCVISDVEERKCNNLRSVVSLKGISPPLRCVRGKDVDNCAFRISVKQADVMSMNDVQRYRIRDEYNLVNLMSENYGAAESTLFYLVAVVKKSSDLASIGDLPGKTTCHSAQNETGGGVIDFTLTQCLNGTSDFYGSFSDAIGCLISSNKDIAFVKFPNTAEIDVAHVDTDNFQLLCSSGVMPLTSANIPDCNLGRVPADVIVTRQTESSGRRQDMMHLLQQAAKEFGNTNSFFRLFYEYYSDTDLLFKDRTTKLTPLADEHYQMFIAAMRQQACHLYEHHLKTSSPLD